MKHETVFVSPDCGETTAGIARPATVAGFEFEAGEIYLFHRSDPQCPAGESLWAVFDRRDGNGIRLESCTDDLIDFQRWCRLPDGYRYCRLASTGELRDYMTALAMFEMQCEPCR